MKNQYILKTFGCKANLYDSQQIEQDLQKNGWMPQENLKAGGEAGGAVDLCIINSCTVTDEADKQVKKMAKRLARENPGAKVVITGCGAEVAPQEMAKAPGVSYVIGNQNKNQLVDLLLEKMGSPETTPITSHILQHEILGSVSQYKDLTSRHPQDREWPPSEDSFQTPPTDLLGSSDKTRCFLKIQEGCDSFCTYCIIPYGRGPSRSLRPRELLRQIEELVQNGIREVILTGTNIGDYGSDWNQTPALAELIRLILETTQLERLRVSSLDPVEITPEIIDLMIGNPRFCPHFHVSLQSPHSKILKLMKRKYDFQDVEACLNRISKIPAPVGGPYVGMDLITGFPGETEQDFEESFQALSNLPWTRLHVFPYSERAGTPATRLPKAVPQHERIRRARLLNKLSMDRLTDHYRKVLEFTRTHSQTLDYVLMEKANKKGWTAGYTPNYLRVLCKSESISDHLSHRNQLVSFKPSDLITDSKNSDVALVGDVFIFQHDL